MTVNGVMTITEFLLARIAEREAVARDLQHQARQGRQIVAFNGGGTGVRELVDPARVLAECEAKRVAVDWYLNDDATVMEATIRALAAVYADHPDYREEWRP